MADLSPEIKHAANPAEVDALIKYALESAVDTEKVTKTLKALRDFEAKRSLENELSLAETYGELVRATLPVTGRTLIDTKESGWFLKGLFVVIAIFLLIAIGNEILRSWLADQPTPDEGPIHFLYNAQRHILDQIAPLVWGAIGSAIYLAKNIYDIVKEQRFDKRKVKGWWLRIVLGAVLAAVVLQIFSPESLSEGEQLPLGAAAVAFLVGLGVKVVYGALERVVDELALRMNLGALRRTPPDTTAVRLFLSGKSEEAKANNGDAQRRLVLAELQAELEASDR